jgi:NAD(P) transhydrogenase subunit beta
MTFFINILYLVAAGLFIFGLKGLTHPRTAVRGNLLGASGMLVAVIATLLNGAIIDYTWIVIGIVIGAGIGAVMAIRVEMTEMPQMVALFNGFGGAASFLVAGAALIGLANAPGETTLATDNMIQMSVATALSGLIGSVTLSGSVVAFGKLQGLIEDPQRIEYQQYINAGLLAGALLFTILLIAFPTTVPIYWIIVLAGLALGVFLVIFIGGADMPVVIALLNSYSGLAAAATGFVIGNSVLIITGSLVGASGIILTVIMCRAMNRSLINVLFGVWVETESGPSADDVYEGKVTESSPDEVAMMLDGVGRVVFVPGYGMAVAQAQHAVRDLTNLLESRGVSVEFAIHPVAGRMPGHMNVLLAEADIDYEKLREMDDINPTMGQVDVAIIIGANDVVNPVAATDPKSPIAGMPIIEAHNARSVVVVKRSLSPGFAGIPNPLFAADNTVMLFADAKRAMMDVTTALKEN